MNFNKRHVLIVGMLFLAIAAAGCTAPEERSTDQSKDLANDTNLDTDVERGSTYWLEVDHTEANQQQLVRAQPPVSLESSLERENLIERYKYLNDRNNIHHVYLISDGRVMDHRIAQGKVSSVNSKLTNDKQIVEIPNARYEDYHGGGAEGPNFKVIESPQLDGSYGTNGDGIFFFDAQDGSYVETNLEYIVSEEPRPIDPGEIVVNVEEDSETNGSAS